MPKSSKKQKDKAADFAKAKLKLGKGKQIANNAVDTSFKARSIAIPSQSITHDKDAAAPTTKRKLTLDDLIGHLKHYNTGARRDAILGLRELLEAHPELILSSLTVLISNCIRMVGDEDAGVRKALLAFMSWLLPQVSTEDIIPHAPALLLFTTSAQTHIFPEIRVDAIRFLDLFLEHIPSIVVEGWTQGSSGHGKRVLEGYLGILNAGTTYGDGADKAPVQATSTASVVLSPGSKLVVLKSLSSFLTHALSSLSRTAGTAVLNAKSSTSSPTPTWYLAPSFRSRAAFGSFDSLLQPQFTNHLRPPSSPLLRIWSEEFDFHTSQDDFVGEFTSATAPISADWNMQDLTNVISSQTGSVNTSDVSSVELTHAINLARTLHSTILSTFLDCAPIVFAPGSSPPETELQLILIVGEIARSLYSAIFQDSATPSKTRDAPTENLKALLWYMYPYFPFVVNGASTARRDIKVEQACQDLSLIVCELTSLLVLASPSPTSNVRLTKLRANATRRTARGPATLHSSTSPLTLQVDRVNAYVVGLLRGETQSKDALPRPIPYSAYTLLLPTIWSLINNPGGTEKEHDDDDSDNALIAVIEHAIRISSSSTVKRATVDFVGRVILLASEPQYCGTFRPGRTVREHQKLDEWILHLPKTLWELGGSNLSTSETILRFLLRLCQRRSRLDIPETLTPVCSRLIPFFTITHATRGKLPGPFSKLPSSPLRRLALDVAATLSHTVTPNSDEGLHIAVTEAVVGTDEAAYWNNSYARLCVTLI